MNDCGIYRIRNLVTDTTYIGSSVKINGRLISHKRRLRAGKHSNPHLLNAWNKYPEDSFIFEPLLLCDEAALAVREQAFMDAYLDHGLKIYNLKPSAESRRDFHLIHSQQSKDNMRAARTPELRARTSAWMKGRKHTLGLHHTKEARAAISRAKKGIPLSLATRLKLSLANKGQKNPSGWKHTAEALSKISSSMKGRVFTPEWRAKISASNTGRAMTEDRRNKISMTLRGYVKSAEHRARLSVTMLGNKNRYGKGVNK